METVINFLTDYTKESVIAALAVLYFSYDKVKAFDFKGLLAKLVPSGNGGSPDTGCDYSPSAVEKRDWESISYLRKRAIELNDKVLLESINDIAIKFLNVTNISDGPNKPSA